MRNMKPLYFSTWYIFFLHSYFFFFSLRLRRNRTTSIRMKKKVRKVVRRMKVVVFFQQLYDQCYVVQVNVQKNSVERKCWRLMNTCERPISTWKIDLVLFGQNLTQCFAYFTQFQIIYQILADAYSLSKKRGAFDFHFKKCKISHKSFCLMLTHRYFWK